MWEDLLKTPNVLYDFIYNLWFIYKEGYMMGMGEKTRNIQKQNQGKIPRLVALPSPLLRNGGRLFSGVRKTPKKSRTHPKLERVPNPIGQKQQGWARYG